MKKTSQEYWNNNFLDKSSYVKAVFITFLQFVQPTVKKSNNKYYKEIYGS